MYPLFTDREAFVDPLKESYAYTIRLVRDGRNKRANVIRDSKEWTNQQDLKDALTQDHDWHLLNDILKDMTRAQKTALNYYARGADWDSEYCHLSYISGGHCFGHDSVVERLVIAKLCPMGGQKQPRTDAEHDAAIEGVLRGSNGSAVRSAAVVLVREKDTTRDC